MKLKLAVAFAATGLLLSIAGTQAITLTGSEKLSATRSEAVNVGCVGGRRCAGGYHYRHGVRVCRSWVVCHKHY